MHGILHFHFPVSELSTASSEYSVKLTSGKTTEKTLRKLAWNVDDLSHLSEESGNPH